MPRSRSKQGRDQATAQIFLRSVSGRSFRDLAEGPLPDDLKPFRAPPQAVDAAVRHMESLGFKTFRDEMGMTVTIEGPVALFAKAFGVAAKDLAKAGAARTINLRAPVEIASLVESIVLTPLPELFG